MLHLAFASWISNNPCSMVTGERLTSIELFAWVTLTWRLFTSESICLVDHSIDTYWSLWKTEKEAQECFAFKTFASIELSQIWWFFDTQDYYCRLFVASRSTKHTHTHNCCFERVCCSLLSDDAPISAIVFIGHCANLWHTYMCSSFS